MNEIAWLAALTAMVGIIFAGGFAGRPGEWEAMLLSLVQHQLHHNKDFLICPYHKSFWKYGELGKYIPPGTLFLFFFFLLLVLRHLLRHPCGSMFGTPLGVNY